MPTGSRPISRTSPVLAAYHRGISAIAPPPSRTRQLVGTERCKNAAGRSIRGQISLNVKRPALLGQAVQRRSPYTVTWSAFASMSLRVDAGSATPKAECVTACSGVAPVAQGLGGAQNLAKLGATRVKASLSLSQIRAKLDSTRV